MTGGHSRNRTEHKNYDQKGHNRQTDQAQAAPRIAVDDLSPSVVEHRHRFDLLGNSSARSGGAISDRSNTSFVMDSRPLSVFTSR
jgi:hypothetical protein